MQRFRSRWGPSPDEPDFVEPVNPAVEETVARQLHRYRFDCKPLDNGPGADGGAGGGIPDMGQDPLSWWKIHANEYPFIARVARKYLAIPAASAAAERMFSYTGLRVGKLNAKLDDEALLSLMMVRALTRFVDEYGPKYLA